MPGRTTSSSAIECGLPLSTTRTWRSARPLPRVTGAFFPAREIIPGLWIGSEGDSRSAAFIKSHGIRLVLNATKNLPFKTKERTYRVPVDDDPSENETMLRYLPVAVVAIDDVLDFGHGVLVHCRAGMQRSAAVVAAYLMWKRGLTADQAFELINARKAETFWPKPTFEAALRTWERCLRAAGRV
jgi:protein-tyrosine phosphatase